MNTVMGNIAEKGLILILFDKRNRSFGNLPHMVPILIKLAFGTCARLMGCQHIIKTLRPWIPRTTKLVFLILIEVPFPKMPGCIPRILEDFGYGYLLKRKFFLPVLSDQF